MLVKRLLEELASGCNSVEELKKKLEVSESTLQTALGMLLAEGLVVEIKAPRCASCTLKLSCPLAKKLEARSHGILVFKLTEKGRKMLGR